MFKLALTVARTMTGTAVSLDVALCQYDLRGADSLDDLKRRVAALFDRAGPADLYVLPELLTTDLVDTSDPTLAETALDADRAGRFHTFVRHAAVDRDAVVIGGSYNVVDGDAAFNRCPVAQPDGTVTVYDKCHPTPEERADGKASGGGLPPVIDHRGVGIGAVICYDVEVPETVRGVVDRGAEVLAVPS